MAGGEEEEWEEEVLLRRRVSEQLSFISLFVFLVLFMPVPGGFGG